jgi:predicted RNA-binding protein
LKATYEDKVELFDIMKEEKRIKLSVVEVKKVENHKEQM